MRRLARILKGAFGFLVVAAPAVLVDPWVQHSIANHPTVAAYLAIAVGILHDLAAARTEKQTAAEVASNGSATMGAK